jgi:hypothetical protein
MANRSNEKENQSGVDPRSFLFYVLQCLAGLEAVKDRKRGSESPVSDETYLGQNQMVMYQNFPASTPPG